MDIIKIDGAEGEGGGSILRLAIAFSVLTDTPIEIVNIRAKRSQPGLKTQHLVGVKAIQELCDAKVEGAELGSTKLYFEPGDSWKDSISVNIATAGSIGLVLQQLQLACYASPLQKITVRISGGATFGKWAPTAPYLEHITLHWLKTFFNYHISLNVHRHGFYPRGGAKATIILNTPNRTKNEEMSVDLSNPGEIEKIRILSIETIHLNKAKVAERQVEAALQELQPEISRHQIDDVITNTMTVKASNPGSGIIIWAETTKQVTFGVDNIGERGVPAEIVGKKAAKKFAWECFSSTPHPPSTDSHLLDQILPFMALTRKFSVTAREITSHAKTNINLIKKFLNVNLKVRPLNESLVVIEK